MADRERALLLELFQTHEDVADSVAPKNLYVNLDVALQHSAFCRGALATNPRVICGINVVKIVTEDFGPVNEACKIIQLDAMRQFFAFLQNLETAKLIVETRRELATLDKDYVTGRQRIASDYVAGDATGSTVMSIMSAGYDEQRRALLTSLRAAERTVNELGLDEHGAMSFLLLSELLECPEARRVLLDFIASDFKKFSALDEWQNPLLDASTFRQLMELVPEADMQGASGPTAQGTVSVVGKHQLQGTTRAAEIAALAPPAPTTMFPEAKSQSVAALIKDRLKADAETEHAADMPSPSPKSAVVRRSAVRLRERERALAELRDKFYDSTTIDDSVLDFPHGPKLAIEKTEAEELAMTGGPSIQSMVSVSALEAPVPAYPAYFNTAITRKKTAKIESRYNKSPPKAVVVAEEQVLSPQGPPISPTKIQEVNTVLAAEVVGMQEQICKLLKNTSTRMDNIFCQANSIKNEGEVVEEGLQLVQELEESVKEIPAAVIGNDRPIVDTTQPIVEKLTSGPDAIRSHHNLFSQFQFKCLGLKDVLAKIYNRADNVAGPELMEQYQKDTAMVGFEKSKIPKKNRVMGSTGKSRRLGSTVRAQIV